MKHKSVCGLVTTVMAFAFACLGPGVFIARGQTGTAGTVSVTVLDPSGAVVPNASLELKDLGTNDVRKALTQADGNYAFPNLPFGTYQLTVSAPGFRTQVFGSVLVQTARSTEVRATLQVGVVTETIQVTGGETPLIATASSQIADTIDTKQVVNLPVQGRNMFPLAFLVPGWSSNAAGSTGGTWNNMPGGAIVSADFDGTPAISNRFRSGGFTYGTSVVQPRIEDIAEMTINTAQLDLSGNGTSAMKISMVTRRGTNAYHGRVFEDFQNTALNANTWRNDAIGQPRNIVKLNDFGFSVGGPILKDKLFFFGTYAESIQPQSISASVGSVLNPLAQQGIFQYRDATGALQSINVLQIGGNAGAPGAVNPNIANQLQQINGVLGQGTLTQNSDPNLSTLSWQYAARRTIYYPALRFDYNATNSVRLNLSYSQTKSNFPGANNPNWPGGIDTVDLTSSNGNNKIGGFGVDWTVRPTLVNQFHGGFMYQYSIFDPENLGLDNSKVVEQYWAYGNGLYDRSYPRQAISSYYPNLSWTDSMNWQHNKHSVVFGGGMMHEQDHYWNGAGGYPGVNLGMTSNDPLLPVFVSALKNLNTTQQGQAEALYATLTGRISSVFIGGGGRPLDPATKQFQPFGAYNLDESMYQGNFFAQDSWRIKPNLTFNYGLRWDIFGDDHDVTGAYSHPASLADFWGPTPVGAMFQPGNLAGVANPSFVANGHAYKTSWINPQPAVGLAWSPQSGGFLGKLFPEGTVIRTGWSLRNYQEGQQNFWAYASNQGLFFFQQGSLSADTSGAIGTFQPGSLFLGQQLPPYALFPRTWAPTLPASTLSFGGNAFFAMNPDIRYPYVEQWNFGIQRPIGRSSALEIRYVGNLGLHTWMSYNINEVNIFENGFLQEFKNAQNNLAINQANGKGNTFANLGLPGEVPLPIFAAAFGTTTGSRYGQFITQLQTGAAGSVAGTLARTQSYICNMFGSAFSPCATLGLGGSGAGYPINFFEANPYTTGGSLNYMDAVGRSNYHSMQVEFRQRLTRGAQFNVNYTWSHSLVLGPVNAYQANVGGAGYTTARDGRIDYRPSPYDLRHVIHASGTYDLPFGQGRMFLSGNRLLDGIFGGWTLGTIVSFQSGPPVQVGGGYATVNGADSGVVFQNGFTVAQLQSAVGVFRGPQPWVNTIDPSLIAPNGGINNAITYVANTTPGVWGYRPYVYGPHWFSADLSINKSVPIRESVRFTLQAQLLNAFNHPTFSLGGLSATSLTFSQVTGTGPTQPRRIEFRANIEF